MRRTVRAAVVLAALLALLGPQPAGAHGNKKLEEIESKIAQTTRQLGRVEQEQRDVAAQLEEAKHEREAVAAEVEALGGDLAAARERLTTLQTDLETVQAELHRWTGRLSRARADLREQQRTLAQRAAAAYKIGPAGYVEIILGAEDFAALADRITIVSNVLSVDARILAGIETSRGLIAQRQELVETLEGRLEERVTAVEAEAERIAELKSRQEDLLAELDVHIDVQGDLFDDLEENKRRYERQVAQLEAESARLKGLIQGSGSQGSGKAGGTFFWPTQGSIGSGYGWRTHPVFGTRRFHSGVDIGGACGQPIWAAESGTVISAGWNGGYGNAVVIDHGKGLSSLYAHQSSIAVSSGQRVSRAQTIGYVGTTGLSTGCHLHFEVRVNGSPVDPVPYLT